MFEEHNLGPSCYLPIPRSQTTIIVQLGGNITEFGGGSVSANN